MEPTPFLDTPNKETEGVDKGRGRISARISRRKRGNVGEGDQMSGAEMRSARARVYIQSHRWFKVPWSQSPYRDRGHSSKKT